MQKDPGRLLLLAVSSASIFGSLNSSMLAVALPAIRREFDVGVGAATILVSGYLIAVAVCQPAAGRLGDAFGHVRVIKIGLAVLLAFSVACAFAWSFPVLVALRSLQGVAAALVAPNAIAYLRRAVTPDRLAGQMGFTAAVIAAGAALGPPLGGLLLTLGDWRWLFAVNVPLVFLSFAFVLRLPIDSGAGRRSLQIDGVSLVALLALFTGITLIGVSLRLGIPALTVAAFALFLAGTVVYGLRYARTGRGVVDLRLFANRNFAAMSAGSALANLVMYSTLITMPIYLRDSEGRGDGFIGVALFVMSAAMVVVSLYGGRLADRLGVRPLLSWGSACLVLAAAGIALAVGEVPVAPIIGLLALIGFGYGLLNGPQTAVAVGSVSREIAGSASGTFSMMRYVGSVAGTALIAVILGGHASAGEFHVLFAILAAVAVVNMSTAFLVRPVVVAGSGGRPVTEALPTRT